jgi:hypothetical protein
VAIGPGRIPDMRSTVRDDGVREDSSSCAGMIRSPLPRRPGTAQSQGAHFPCSGGASVSTLPMPSDANVPAWSSIRTIEQCCQICPDGRPGRHICVGWHGQRTHAGTSGAREMCTTYMPAGHSAVPIQARERVSLPRTSYPHLWTSGPCPGKNANNYRPTCWHVGEPGIE